MQPTSEYSRKMQAGKSLSLDEEGEMAKILDDRTAILADGTRLRLTPKGQKTVDQIVFSGDEIKTSYGSTGRVVGVHRCETYGLPNYTIVMVDLERQPSQEGFYRELDLRWVNECVAQDDQVRKLFEANEDVVEIVKECTEARRQQTQQSLFGAAVQQPYLKTPDGTRHAIIVVTVETTKKEDSVYALPYWHIDYECNGCLHRCGGGHCCQKPEEVDQDIERYKQRLVQCRDSARGIRRIIITVKDDRARTKRQERLVFSRKRKKE